MIGCFDFAAQWVSSNTRMSILPRNMGWRGCFVMSWKSAVSWSSRVPCGPRVGSNSCAKLPHCETASQLHFAIERATLSTQATFASHLFRSSNSFFLIEGFDFAAQQRLAKVLHHVVEVASHRSSRVPGSTVDRPLLASQQWGFSEERNKTKSCVFCQENVGCVCENSCLATRSSSGALKGHSNCCASCHCKAAIEPCLELVHARFLAFVPAANSLRFGADWHHTEPAPTVRRWSTQVLSLVNTKAIRL